MANPSSSTTPTLGLELLYEGVKVDNDIFNNNFTKIDNALKGVMMFEKLVGTTITSPYRNGVVTTNYPTTNFDFMVIKLLGGGVDASTTTSGAVPFENLPPIKIPKPTATISYDIPVYNTYSTSNDPIFEPISFTTTNFTLSSPSNSWRQGGRIIIEYYKYATA